MDISNSYIAAPVVSEGVKRATQERPIVKENSAPAQERQAEQVRNLAAPAELERKSNELQLNKVQRLNSLDSAPLRTQQAVNTYEQTLEAGRAYEEGELVGIDLFV